MPTYYLPLPLTYWKDYIQTISWDADCRYCIIYTCNCYFSQIIDASALHTHWLPHVGAIIMSKNAQRVFRIRNTCKASDCWKPSWSLREYFNFSISFILQCHCIFYIAIWEISITILAWNEDGKCREKINLRNVAARLLEILSVLQRCGMIKHPVTGNNCGSLSSLADKKWCWHSGPY